MKNEVLAGIIGDALVTARVIAKDKLDAALDIIERKLEAHLGETISPDTHEVAVSNTHLEADSGTDAISEFRLNPHVVRGSVQGQVYRKHIAIQTFTISEDGKFSFKRVGQPSNVEALSGSIEHGSGKVFLTWNAPPGTNHVVVSYSHLADEVHEAE